MTSAEYVTFRVGGQLWAAPVGDVREVLTGLPITAVPRAGRDVAGLANVRGEVLCVLDLCSRLGLPPSPRPPGGVVVCDRGAELVGLTVEEMLDVELLPPPSPAGEYVDGRTPVVGSVDHEGRLFQIIDVGAVADPQVLAVHDREV